MLAKGYWRASQPFNGIASFQDKSALFAVRQWGSMVVDWLEACKSVPKLEVFTNTVLGDVWKPVEQIQYEQLAWLLESYPVQVPDGVIVLTAGVDIQKDRIEVEVVGWGFNNESWSIDYRVFEGQTGVDISTDFEDDPDLEPLSGVWEELAEYLSSSFAGSGTQTFRIQCVAIDSGYLTTRVYKFCKRYAARRWFAVKGMSDPFKPLAVKADDVGQKSEGPPVPDRHQRRQGRGFCRTQNREAGPELLPLSRTASRTPRTPT
jgi:phage terminase large subunit GpA-like protein